MTITGDTGGKGTKAIATRSPVDDGIIGGTTKQTGHKMNLTPTTSSNVLKKDKKGIN